MRLLVEAGADEETRLQFVPGSDVPVRQYFHSRSNEPMLPGEWDVDSDDEDDEGWLTIMSEQVSFATCCVPTKLVFNESQFSC